MKKTAVNTAQNSQNKLVRRASGLMALEPRFMFDGAAAVDAVDKTVHLEVVTPVVGVMSDAAVSAKAAAEKVVAEYLARPDIKEQLFTMFNGGQAGAQPSAAWVAAFEQLLNTADQGNLGVRVELRSNTELQGAKGAFAAQGTTGRATIYLNADWLNTADSESVAKVMVEEIGHFLDATLNSGADTPGDEGEIFSRVLIDSANPLSVSYLSSQDDHATLQIDGQSIQTELASFNFVNAYAMVYDLNNNGSVVGSTGETPAEKEQSTHNFNPTGLGAVSVSDGSNGNLFSGNDVSAIALNVGGQTYYGWISRPIKSGGIVRGFYFWTDNQFTTLALAQADGNMDTDGAADNKGFLLVVDQAWFSSQITSTSTTVTDNIDNNANLHTYSSLGSSSDRVDSALNALVTSNVGPIATSDTASGSPSGTLSTGAGNAALEQGYNTNTSTVITATIAGSGNVLANDIDSNGDALLVTTVSSKSLGTSTTATSGGVNLVGKYGTLTIKSDGNWTYAPDNTNATVNALLSGSLQEQFTYTASDGKGGTATATLTVQINGSNDAPVAVNDYNTAKEITSSSNTGYTATGNVLPNDSDVDSGDTKTVAGLQINGSMTAGTVTNVTPSSNLTFTTTESSFNNSTISGKSFYYYDGAAYRLVHDANGNVVTAGSASSTTVGGVVYWTVPLSATPSYYNSTGNTGSASDNVLITNFNSKAVLFDSGTNETTVSGGNAKTATSTSNTTVGSTINVSGVVSGTLSVGMTLMSSSSGSFTVGTKISDLTYTNGVLTQISLDKTVSFTSGSSLTFTGNGATGVTLQGAHGSLSLASNGSYTYTPTTDNPYLSSGQSAIEVFDYTMQDAAGVTSVAKLYITVYGSGSNDPTTVADSFTAYESGVGRQAGTPYTLTNDNTAFAGVNVTTNSVLSNDTTPGGTSGLVVSSYTKADGTGTTNAGSVLTGTYGTLNIASNGVVTYLVDNTNLTVQALLPGATLTDTYRYKVTNSASGNNWGILTITIQGTNDAPVAVLDTGALTEDAILSASGNVLTNDADVDSGDSKVVSKAGTSLANTVVTSSTTSTSGLSINGTYGTLTIGADGTYVYMLASSADGARYTALQALTQGQQASEVFNYEVKDANGATSITTLTFTITGANEAPINNFNGTPISSTSSTSLITAANTSASPSYLDFTGPKLLSVSDADNNLTTITLVVEHGTLSFTTAPSNVTLSSSSGSTITISAGTQDQLNAALALLRYTPTQNFYGTDFLTINSKDGYGARDVDGIAINIPAVTTASVSESALATGSGPSSTLETYSGTVTRDTSQTIASQQNGVFKDGSNNTIGTWVVNTDGTFSVTLTAASAATSSSFTYVVYDAYGNAVNNSVNISITDDVPTAVADSGSVTEDSASDTVTGNLISGTGSASADTTGADTPVTVVGVAATGTNVDLNDPTKVGVNITGGYGRINVASNGAYTYTLDNLNATVNALDNGQSLTDVFTYTIKDADGSLSHATVTITINGHTDTTASFIINDVTVNEAAGTMTFTVVNSGATTGTSSVQYAFADGTATGGGTDYTGTAGTLTFAAGDTSKTITVAITDDSVYEGSESFNVNLSNATNATISDAQGVGTIKDDGTGDSTHGGSGTGTNDDRPSFAINDVTVNEAAGTMTFTVTKTGATALDSSVQYAFADGTATGGGTDYTGTAGTLTFAAGDTSKTITVTIINDSVYEGSESFNVNLSSATNATISDAQGVGTIKDDGTGNSSNGGSGTGTNDDRPSFAINDVTVNEAAGTMTFTVTKTGATALDSSVQYAFADGTATGGGTDYTGTAGTLTFAAGDTSKTITVTIINDSVYEGSESFNVNLSSATNATISDAQGVGTIKDDGTGDSTHGGSGTGTNDDRPSFAIDDVTVNEAAGTMTFTVTKTGLTNLASSVDFAFADGTTTGGGTDYTGTAGTLSFVAGDTSKTITVTINNDGVYEGSESFNVNLSNATNATISDAQGVGTIKDDGTGSGGTNDDRALSVNSITVNEGNGTNYAVFTVTANAGQTLTLALGDGTANPTATSGTDYTNALEYWSGTAWLPYTAAFAVPGATNAQVSLLVRVAITGDSTYEGAEDFKLTASYTSGASRSATGVATIVDDGTGTKYTSGNPSGSTPATDATNLDDDRGLTVTGGSYNEGSPRAVFTVNATAGLVLTLDVQNAAQPGKAPTGDNEGKPNDSLDNAPLYYSLDGGATWQLYSIPIMAGNVPVLVAVDITNERDDVYEGEEQLKLVVTTGSQSASGYSSIFDDGTGTVTKEINGQTRNDTGTNDPSVVKDDDRPITVTGANYNENSPRAVFTVNANPGQVLSLDVQNAAEPGKAPTGDNEGKPNDSLDMAPIYYSLDGGATWQLYTGPITAGNVPVLVAVDITNERDDVYEGEEQLKLVVTSGGQSVSGYSSIFDDGTGLIKQADGTTDNITPKDDDRPKPAPVVLPPEAPAPKAAAPEVTQPDPVKPPPQVFSSEVQPLAPRLVPVEAPVPLGDILTSSSGFRVAVNETASPGLALNRGITDQFVEGNGTTTKVSMPYDAFIHSNKDAVIKLDAKLADNSPLPNWVRFDPATGSFEVNPPKNFKGKLDLKVVALDDDGREATALFQMFVGDKPAEQKPQSRNSLTEKLRLAGHRPVTLIKVGTEMTRTSAASEFVVRTATAQRATAG